MKKINIINSLSPEKQYAIRRWFYITIGLSFILFIMAAYLLIPHIFSYLSLKKDILLMQHKTSNYTTHFNAQESLKKEYDELTAHETKINGYLQQLKNPYAHMAYIVFLCKDGVQLESIGFQKKDVEIIIQCPTSKQAYQYAKWLTESELFSAVKIISLQKNDTQKHLLCTIKAYVIF